MENPAQDIDLDLRGTVCPMAFVKLRLFADQLSAADTFQPFMKTRMQTNRLSGQLKA